MVSKRTEEGDLFPRGAGPNSTPRIRKRNGEILFGPEAKRPRESRQPADDKTPAKEAHVVRSGIALTYKRITPGTTILALVVRARQDAVEFVLPGGLRAVAIDDTLAPAAQTRANGPALDVRNANDAHESDSDDASSSDDESDEGADATALCDVLRPGQVLPVCVTEREVKHRHRTYVAVSLKPDLVNYGLNPSHLLTKNFPTYAVVRSVEDHGYVLSFGSKVRNSGFLPFKSVPLKASDAQSDDDDKADEADDDNHDNDENRMDLKVGTPLCVITRKDVMRKKKLSAASAAIRVSALPKHILPTAVDVLESATFQDIRAGMLLRGRVMAIGPGGVSLLAMGVFPVSVDASHVARKDDGSLDVEKDKTVLVRVLYADASVKSIVGTLLPSFVTELKPPTIPGFVKVGTLLKNLEVESVKTGFGLVLRQRDATGPSTDEGDEEGNTDIEMEQMDSQSDADDDNEPRPRVTVPIVVHVNHIEDGKHPHLEAFQPKTPIALGGRVVFISKFDGQLSVDLRKSILSRKAVTIDELEPGTVYNCRIIRHTKSGGLVVAIEGDEHLDGVVPEHQLSDVSIAPGRLAKHEALRVGSALKCRVVSIRLDQKKTYLTARPSMLSPKYPILTSVEDAAKALALSETRPGKADRRHPNVYTGSASHVTDSGGLVVRFCNGVAGLVPRGQLCMSEDSGKVEDVYPEGETVSVRVTGVDEKLGRLRLSMNLKPDNTSSGKPDPKHGKSSEKEERPAAKKLRLEQVVSSLKVMAHQDRSRLVGMEVSGWLTKVFPSHAYVGVGPGCTGHLHVTNVSHIDDETLQKLPSGLLPKKFAAKYAFPELNEPQTLFAVDASMSVRDEKEHLTFELTMEERNCELPVLEIGRKVVGIVQSLSTKHGGALDPDGQKQSWTRVAIGRNTSVTCHDVECLQANFGAGLKVGSLVVCRITYLQEKSSKIRGALSDNGSKRDKPFTAIVVMVLPYRGVLVKIPTLARDSEEQGTGLVNICEVSDDFDEASTLMSSLKSGDEVVVRRVKDKSDKEAGEKGKEAENNGTKSEKSDIKLTMRTGKNVNDKLIMQKDLSTLKEGTPLRGFVKEVSKAGCFVNIGRDVCALVKMCDLDDDFVNEPKTAFPVGKLVSGKIVSVHGKKGNELVAMSLRTRERKDLKGGASHELKEGMVVEGTVKKIDRWGCIVALFMGASGLLHVSEADQDRTINEPWDEWAVGQRLKVVVIRANNKVSFGTKRCYFEAAGLDEDDIDEVLQQNFEAKSRVDEPTDPNLVIDLDSAQPAAPVGGQVIQVDSSDDEVVANLDNADAPQEIEDEKMKDDDEEEEEEEVVEVKPTVPALKVSERFDFTDNPKPQVVEEEEEEAKEEPKEELKKTSKDKREKKRLREAAENEIQLREEALARNDDSPETAEDFERMLITEPNSSVLWIRYMAFCLQISQVEKARSVAERALETIKLEKEVDRTNVWVAYINLEAGYGGMNDAKDGGGMREDVRRNAAVFRVFDRGCERITDVKNFHLQVAAALRTNQPNLADEVLRRATRKFRQSKKVWIALGHAQFTAGNAKEARRTLDRALLSAEKRKHVVLITKFAHLEYKFGSSERGRTVFESIAGNLPKRVDLWNIYLDMEIGQCKRAEGEEKTAAVDRTRRLFERFTSLNLSVKKMKFAFKKWQEFEKAFGGPIERKEVKTRAQAWVDRALSSKKES